MRSRHLINGFIRKIDATLKNKIIPHEINELCFLFYFTSNVLYYFTRVTKKNNNGLYIYDIDSNRNFECQILDINTPDHRSNPGAIGYTIPYIAKNINLPEKISHKINKHKAFSCDTIFKCGGHSDANGDSAQCQAIVFNSWQLDTTIPSDNKQILTAYCHKLPSLPVATWGTTAVYSNINGLYCVGGYICDKIYNLSDPFDSYADWNCVATFEKGHDIAYTSAIFISDYQLFICGGRHNYNDVSTTRILNTNSYEWIKLKDCKNERQCAGILYDKILNRVYVGGGSLNNQSVEYYDIVKQQWYELVETNCKYAFCPMLWVCNNDNNMLNIAGIKSKAREVLDLRTQKQWELIYGNVDNISFGYTLDFLEAKFNTPLLYNHRSWLLC